MCCHCVCCVTSVICFFFFFFKQKTAYEMRISDWSSDVCSSDLTIGSDLVRRLGALDLGALRAMDGETLTVAATKAGFAPQGTIDGHVLPRQVIDTFDRGEQEIGRASCRERVCQYV